MPVPDAGRLAGSDEPALDPGRDQVFRVPLGEGESVTIDTGHVVAFTEALDFSITKAGKSWVSSFLGGEGLVCKFKGRGRVYCQSHNPPSFGRAVGKLLKPRTR